MGRGWGIIGAVLVLGGACRGGRVAAADELATLCTAIRPAYVFIAGGSGVVVRPDGLMLTNDHVLENRCRFDVRLGDGRSFKARVLGRDEVGDLAVLKIDAPDGEPLPHLPLGDSETVRVGDEVMAVGNPFALGVIDQSPTFTLGIVSAVQHTQGTYTECIVTDAELNPGNSGGPLVNRAGEVVGVNGQISTRYGLRSNTGLGFAISARQIALWLPRLEKAEGGEVNHARLTGVQFESRDRERPESIVVKTVAEGSPAADAGFQAGDAIVAVDGIAVVNGHRFAGLIGVYPEGHEAAFRVRRAAGEETLRAVLTAPQRCQTGIDLARPRGGDLLPLVEAVEEGSSAKAAGLKPGDVIVAFAGRRLEFSSRDDRRAFDRGLRTRIDVGDIVPLTVRRKEGGGEPVEVELRLVAR
ncbi:MAG: trypsin-like peptidase domain-containing protein [Planctomycetaceae bacterium]